jgi:hypothetical protein
MAGLGSATASIGGAASKQMARLATRVYSAVGAAAPLADDAIAGVAKTASPGRTSATLTGSLDDAINAMKELNEIVPRSMNSWHNNAHGGTAGVRLLTDAREAAANSAVPKNFGDDMRQMQRSVISMLRGADDPTINHAARAFTHLDEATSKLPEALKSSSLERQFALDWPLRLVGAELRNLGHDKGAATVGKWVSNLERGWVPMDLPGATKHLERQLVRTIDTAAGL